MNERGKLKHRVHILIFRRGETPAQDEVVVHVVTRVFRTLKVWKRLIRQYGPSGNCEPWVVTEEYWRVFGMAGRNREADDH